MWGQIAAAAIGAYSAKKTNQAASAQAARQMEFQKEQSDTAHQREVKDLRAAGLNPILSGTGGQGASTPAGAQAPVIDPASTTTKSVSSAMALQRLESEINLLDAQAANNYASATKTGKDILGFGAGGKKKSVKAVQNQKKTSSAKSAWKNPKLNKIKAKPLQKLPMSPFGAIKKSGMKVWDYFRK